jgi:dihydrofolate reductase
MIMPNISIIVAIAENYAIGKNNDLLWHIPDDLKRFKKLTTGHTVVMGKNTYFSLPIKPLPNRTNIVISDDRTDHFEGCAMAYSIEGAINLMEPQKENFIMGGGMVYRSFLPLANKLYVTRVHKYFDADIFFPEINPEEWQLLSSTEQEQSLPQKLRFTYEVFQRIEIV